MDVINAGMRKAIKRTCAAAQTLQFIALMPKPQDFVTRVIGDVVYMSSQIQKLSEKMNKLLDDYAEIPGNYLMTQMNSITGSLSNITNRVNAYTQNAINQVMDLGENSVSMVTDAVGAVIDSTGAVTNAVTGITSAVVQGGAYISGNASTAEDIYDGTEVILEWTKNGFKNLNNDVTTPLKKVEQSIKNKKQQMTNSVNNVAEEINSKVADTQKFVENLIKDLRDKMKKLSDTLDNGFKDVTGMSAVSKGTTVISEGLNESGNYTKEVQATIAITNAMSDVIKNFSIGKTIAAFAGVLTQSAIVRLGLDQLPPIDFESMLHKIRDDLEMTTDDLYEQYASLSDSAYKELIDFGEESKKINEDNEDELYSEEDERDYSDDNYQEFKMEYDEELKNQRDAILNEMKDRKLKKEAGEERPDNVLEKKELKSAIKEIKKFRKKIQKARQTDTMKSVLIKELDNLRKEVEYRSNSIKSDWESMLSQYNKCIKEVKSFFSGGGSCDMFIDDCCDQINLNFNAIKELCKNLTTQLICCSIKVAMPADVGPVAPNPVYKLSDFWQDIKTIFKFIKDLIEKIIAIINNINKIARIMLNGLNSLSQCIQDLMEVLNLKWLMNLIQEIINLFGDKINSANIILTNSLAPVYFDETNEYSNALEELESVLESINDRSTYATLSKSTINSLSAAETVLLRSNVSITNIRSSMDRYNRIYLKGKVGGKDRSAIFTEQIENLINELDSNGNVVVAYKSPIIKEVKVSPTVSDLMNGGELSNDLKFIGWYFFHPNLNHNSFGYNKIPIFGKLIKKIKEKLIKKASKAKNRNWKKTGISKLRNSKVGIGDERKNGYDAFFWYTYYTEDLEKDCFEYNAGEKNIYIDSVMKAQNGSIVELSDGRKVFVADNSVKSGDYVNVNGVKYRVK